MKIYRGIAINENETINSDLGISWTLDVFFAKDHAKSISSVREKDGYVVLEADIDEDAIDVDNTLFAMEKRPHESEVVLIHGTELSCIVQMTFIDSIERLSKIEGIAVTDTTFEDYCNTYEGDLTMEDFFDYANEF